MEDRSFNLAERHAENLAEFSKQIAKSRFWHVLPEGERDVQKSTGVFDSHNGLIYPSVALLRAFCAENAFAYLKKWNEEAVLATLDTSSKLLWSNSGVEGSSTVSDVDSLQGTHLLHFVLKGVAAQVLGGNFLSHEEGREAVRQGKWAGLAGWGLPNKDQLIRFASNSFNPHRGNQGSCLLTAKGALKAAWLVARGGCDLSKNDFPVTAGGGGCLFAVHDLLEAASPEEMLVEISHRGWCLVAPGGGAFQPDSRWVELSVEKLLASLVLDCAQLVALDQEKLVLNPSTLWIDSLFVDLDYTPCRLPKLDCGQLSDPEKGIWELWGEAPGEGERFGLVARDPGQDVQRRAVAIDFGTSSTVVAMDTASGGRELLRIGVRDFYQEVKPQHFENPTVLECLDFSAFEQAWTERAYRPALDWSWMRAAHEAQASFRDNPGDTKILASILPRLKQWALRSDRSRVRLTDRKNKEIELAAHQERNPVRGQALSVDGGYPFDPIELYAWYLGMAINWRGRGIFLHYYLSFPVKYPREVKDRILASFRRGLQRSLPRTLIDHHPQVLNDFEVSDLASEPAAYAAAALPYLGVKPTDQGVPYAVFDFGGGTTDFDFGVWRWATAEEEEQGGYEQVFEHLASSGDNYLGGENLLEHLVYVSFQHNLDVLREARIQFTKPLDALPFVGSEAFLATTQAAQTNTVLLAAKLRPFLEGEYADLPSQIKLDLISVSGDKKACELILDAEGLDSLLAGRIRRAAEAFLSELASLSLSLPADTPIQVLLAGNGSRLRHIKMLFDREGELWRQLLEQIFDAPPMITVHSPLPVDQESPHAPTTKTGVALGLLRLSPGKNVLLKNHVNIRHDGQAPFAWFVGRLRRGSLDPVLSPNVHYGQWHEVGRLQDGVFCLYASTSPRAHAGLTEGDPELKMFRLSFHAAPIGSRLFAKAIAPNAIELSAVGDQSELEACSVMRFVLE